MMDSAMHKIGLHGKALIPLILGYGCNVPAIQSCKIMETRRERLLAAFAITFAPCTARTLVILGLVGAFLGVQWALALYVVDIALIFLLGRIAMKAVPGKSTGLIMEMHGFKVPSLKVITKQTWGRTKSLIYMVFPIYIFGSAAVQALYALNVLTPISNALSPLTVGWLGLPVARNTAYTWHHTQRIRAFGCRSNFQHYQSGIVLLASATYYVIFGVYAVLALRSNGYDSWKRIRLESSINDFTGKYSCSGPHRWLSLPITFHGLIKSA